MKKRYIIIMANIQFGMLAADESDILKMVGNLPKNDKKKLMKVLKYNSKQTKRLVLEKIKDCRKVLTKTGAKQ